jgi:hypothetical protein
LERDHKNCQQEKKENKKFQSEREFVQKLNEDLQLGLDSELTWNQIIVVIKELLTKPPTIITENLEEDLATIKEIDWKALSKILPSVMNDEVKKAMKEAIVIENELL